MRECRGAIAVFRQVESGDFGKICERFGHVGNRQSKRSARAATADQQEHPERDEEQEHRIGSEIVAMDHSLHTITEKHHQADQETISRNDRRGLAVSKRRVWSNRCEESKTSCAQKFVGAENAARRRF